MGIFLYILQIACFIFSQISNISVQEFIKQSKAYAHEVEDVRRYSTDQAVRIYQEKKELDPVSRKIYEKLIYLNEYPKEIGRILEAGTKQKKFSVFQDNKGGYAPNITRTLQDFEKMKNIELSIDRDRVTESIAGYSWTSYFVFAFVVFILYELFKDTETGFIYIIHTTPYGRGVLGRKRIFIISIVTILFYFLCYATNICISCALYGVDDFSGKVQTIKFFSNYVYPISKGTYLFLLALESIFCLFAVEMVAFMLFTVIRNRFFAIAIIAFFTFIEYRAFMSISMVSPYKVFKIINVIKFFNLGETNCNYQNLVLFGHAFHVSSVLYVVASLCMVLSGMAILVAYEKQYPLQRSILDSVIKIITNFVQRLVANTHFSGKELYKLLLSGRMYLLILFVICMERYIISKTVIIYPEIQNTMDEVYMEYGGNNRLGFCEYVDALSRERNQLLAQAEDITAKIQSGEYGYDKNLDVINLMNRASALEIFLREYESKIEDYKEILNERNIDTYIMSDRGYVEAFGQNSILREMVIGIMLSILAVILSSHYFELEKKNYMLPIFRTTKRGEAWVFRKKVICISKVLFSLWLICFMGDYLFLYFQYGMPFIEAPVQSLSFMQEESAQISIGIYLFIQQLFRLLHIFHAAFSTIAICIFWRKKNDVYVALLSLLYVGSFAFIVGLGKFWAIYVICMGMIITIPMLVYFSYKSWIGIDKE